MPLNPKSLFDPYGDSKSRFTRKERGTLLSDRATDMVRPFGRLLDKVPADIQESKKTKRTRPGMRRPSLKQFPVKYGVDPIAQPNWNSCFPTAMLMLAKWRDSFLGMRMYHDDLEGEVYMAGKTAAKTDSLRSLRDLQTFCVDHGFLNSKIDVNPETFESQLRKSGPFGYLAKAGNGFQHTLIITGIEARADGYNILFNDPDGGTKGKKEFHEFIWEHRPAFTGDSVDKAFIVSPFQQSIQQRK